MSNEKLNSSKIEILIYGKLFLYQGNSSYISIKTIFNINQKTIDYLKKENKSLILDITVPFMRVEKESGYNFKTKAIPRLIISSHIQKYKSLSHEIIKKRTSKYSVSYTENELIRYEIKPDQIDDFLKTGQFQLKERNYSFYPILLKIKDRDNNKITSPLAYFSLGFTYITNFKNNISHINLSTNLEANQLIHKKAFWQNFNVMNECNFINCYDKDCSGIFFIDYYAKSYNRKFFQLPTEKKPKAKKYYLVKLIKTNKTYIDYSKKRSTPYYPIPKTGYNGNLVHLIDETRLKLIPENKVPWIYVDGEFYLPVPYHKDHIKVGESSSMVFDQEQKEQSIRFLKPVLLEGVSLKELHFNPYTQKWDLIHFTGLPDKTTTSITCDKTLDLWKSTSLKQWNGIKNPFSHTLSVKKNFSVTCTHRQDMTIAKARGVDKFAQSSNFLKKAVYLVDLLPKETLQRPKWKKCTFFCVQQSTHGILSKEQAYIVDIDPKTKKIRKIYNKSSLGKALPFKLSNLKNRSLIFVFGPGTARLDLAPTIFNPEKNSTLYAQSDYSHTIFVTGYMQSKSGTIPDFNY